MKPLLPILKERKRYIVYEFLTEKPLLGSPEQELVSYLQDRLGLFDGAKSGLLSVRYDQKKGVGVLRVSHKSVDKVKSALLLIKNIGGVSVIPRVRGVSGILKKTEEFVGEEKGLAGHRRIIAM